MAEFGTGDVRANGLRFYYLEMGEGPLALCLHGFPDSPWTYRYLLPELAEAGYRAVAPFSSSRSRRRSTTESCGSSARRRNCLGTPPGTA